MKIDTSVLSLSATHDAHTHDESSETLRVWVGDKRPDFERLAPSSVTTLSDAARVAAQIAPVVAISNPECVDTQAIKDATNSEETDPQLSLIKLMVEMITGQKIKSISASDLQAVQAPAVQLVDPNPQNKAPKRAGFGVEYDSHHLHTESEQTNVQATGIVRTTDGKEIHVNISLQMSRNYTEESSESFRAGDGVKKDPLVINFGGTAAQLQNQRFRFDIDGDGKADALPMLASNSGYLALDLNGNGKIDSGKELFGATSGNGFKELAQYDDDHNGWIDESDAVFKLLEVWRPDEEGTGTLTSLKQNDVGAISLTNVASPFALKDGANSELGAVRATGVYLSESGEDGTVQQIDLKV